MDPAELSNIPLATRRLLRPGYVREDVDRFLREVAEATASL